MSLEIINGDCLEIMKTLEDKSIDVILTSPPYNISTGLKSNKEQKCSDYQRMYDVYIDSMTSDEYCKWVSNLFISFDRILKDNGVVIWNTSYSSNSQKMDSVESTWLSIAEILKTTDFSIADKITWKKNNAIPNNSSNKLSRMCEDVFVFARRKDFKTFKSNKKIICEKNGSKFYENIHNLICAKNNDSDVESRKLNTATFSTEFAEKLLAIYALPNSIVLDPFSGTGTTLNACKNLNLNGIGIELSESQCEYARKRINFFSNVDLKIDEW